ncbi:MAG: hypothetical protein ACKV0T_14670 [Planctomycetales bacterium]
MNLPREVRDLRFFGFLILLGMAPALHAGIVTPAGLTTGDQFRMVFVTNGTIDATVGDHTVYDNLALAEAANGGFNVYDSSPVTWLAMVSTVDGTIAKNRLPKDGVAIYLTNGTKVADSGADLWNVSFKTKLLESPIYLTPTSTHYESFVWTGSRRPLGIHAPTVGLASSKTPFWNAASDHDEHARFPIYGFSSALTVSAPEPANVTLALNTVFVLLIFSLELWGRFRSHNSQRGLSCNH